MNRIQQLYLALLEKHGPPENFWPQWCAQDKNRRTREVIIIGAVLTQRTSWHNANLALKNLKSAGLLSIGEIASLTDLGELIELIRPAGFYTTKPQRLFDLCSFISKNYPDTRQFTRESSGMSREKLSKIKGIGPETADTILLYAFDQPVFVVDAYTQRFAKDHQLTDKLNYEHLQYLFQENLLPDAKIFQNYHALIIIDQKGQSESKMEIV